jgi:hypothetical protein
MIFHRLRHARGSLACAQHDKAAPWRRRQKARRDGCRIGRADGRPEHAQQKGFWRDRLLQIILSSPTA